MASHSESSIGRMSARGQGVPGIDNATKQSASPAKMTRVTEKREKKRGRVGNWQCSKFGDGGQLVKFINFRNRMYDWPQTSRPVPPLAIQYWH
jgi:hypothetical protein